jgi:protein-L-isoaspartate(D-aspartate) O-methyltransferase
VSAALAVEAPREAASYREGTAAFVLSLRARGVFDTNVLRAMETVPRDFFAPRRFADLARSDVALPIPCGQTMTAPIVVATMLAALDVRPGHRVLEVGTGTGYVTALLAKMGAEVRSLERQPILAESARNRLLLGGFGQVELGLEDGLDGGQGEGCCDRILLNGVVPHLSPVLTSRLVAGGRLVGAVSRGGAPRLFTLSREPDGRLSHALGPALRISTLVETRED